MKNEFKRRESFIMLLAIIFTSFLQYFAIDFKTQHFFIRSLVFCFMMLGIAKFITGLFALIAPIKEDPRNIANKAIVKEFFK